MASVEQLVESAVPRMNIVNIIGVLMLSCQNLLARPGPLNGTLEILASKINA